MKDSIHKYFKIGTLQWMSFNQSLPIESLHKIGIDDFFDVVEVKGYDTKKEREQAKTILSQSHLAICYGAQPRLLAGHLNPNALEEVERKKAEAALLDALDEAAYLGAEGIAFLSGNWSPETKELAYQQLLKTTRTLCDAAASSGMMVELEIFDYDVDKAALIGPAPYAAKFAADVRTTHGNFGLLVDLSHIPLTHECSQFVVRTLRPYITHFHFGNAVTKPEYEGYGDYHPRMGYPNSANDVEELLEYLRVLKEEGFFNSRHPYILSAEVAPRDGEDEQLILANTKRVLNRAWALLEDF